MPRRNRRVDTDTRYTSKTGARRTRGTAAFVVYTPDGVCVTVDTHEDAVALAAATNGKISQR